MAHCSKSTQVNSKLEPQFIYQNTINFSTLGSNLSIQLMGSTTCQCSWMQVKKSPHQIPTTNKYAKIHLWVYCKDCPTSETKEKLSRDTEFFSNAQSPVQKWCTWKYTKLSMQAKDQWNRVGQVERSPISSHLWWNQQSGWEQSLVQFHWHVFWVPVLLLMPIHIYPFRSNLEKSATEKPNLEG